MQTQDPNISKDLIDKISELVGHEFTWDEVDTDDYGVMPENAHDSFGEFDLCTNSEPEDAIWMRDHQHNFYCGLDIGIRNTIKVIKEHPELLA